MAQAQPKRKQSPAAGSARGSLGYEEDGLDAPGRPNSSGSESSLQRRSRERAAAAAAPSGKTIVEEIVAVDDDAHAEAAAGHRSADATDDAVVDSQEKQQQQQQQRSMCSRMIHAIWATKLTEDLKDSTAKAKTMLRELVIYFIYLIVLSVITFGSYSSNMFRMTDALSAIFLNSPFPDFSTNNYLAIGHMGDWAVFLGRTNQSDAGSTRGWLDGPFLAGMYPDRYYNDEPIENSSLGYIAFENMLLGVPRLRQVRVRNDSCKISNKYLNKLIGSCYAEYSSSAEEKRDRTPPTVTNLTATAWVYSSASITQGSTHLGLFGTYGGGGYYQDLARDRNTSIDIINELIVDNMWLDRGTRAAFIDFTVYNPNFNLFSVVRLITEFPPVGGALSSYIIRTVKLLRYESAEDFIIMGFEYAFCAFVFYYLVEELLEIKQVKLSYFKSFWNLMDICGLLLSVACIAFNVYRTMAVEFELEAVMEHPDHYVDFESLSYWQFAFNYCVGILVFISWVKVFKYLSFNRTMNQMTRTLSAAKRDLGGFMVMFFIVFFAFAQLGYLLFGSLVDDYKSLKTCIQTLLRILLGDFDYQSLKDARSLGGPFFFLFYILVVLFILFNMFMAILNDAYSEVKSNLVNEKNEFEVFDFFKDQYSAMLQKLHLKRDKIIDIQDALRGADMNDDRLVSYEEWKRELQVRGYTDDEIASAFAKYDIDQNGFLDGSEQDAMMADLEAQKNAVHEEMAKVETKINRPSSARPSTSAARSEDGAASERKGSAAKRDGDAAASANGEPEKPRVVSEVSYSEFNAVARRIDRLEHSIGSIVSKIDCVLVKLEVMETAKLRRREAMTALLDSLTAGENFTEEERKRQMERLVKEELERFDNEIVASGRPGSSASSRPVTAAGAAAARPPTGGKR